LSGKYGRGEREERTHHVALLVLSAKAVRDVRLDTKIENGEVFDRVPLWIQAANDAKSLAIVDVSANCVQSGAQCGKREVVLTDEIPVQA
jgi:hypothetical protein